MIKLQDILNENINSKVKIYYQKNKELLHAKKDHIVNWKEVGFDYVQDAFKMWYNDKPCSVFEDTTEQPVTTINISKLIVTQNWLNFNKNKNMKISNSPIQVIKYKNKYYLEDGHHRIFTDALANKYKAKAQILDVDKLECK